MVLELSPIEPIPVVKKQPKISYARMRHKLKARPSPFGTHIVDAMEKKGVNLSTAAKGCHMQYRTLARIIYGEMVDSKTPIAERLRAIADYFGEKYELLDTLYYQDKKRPVDAPRKGIPRGRDLTVILDRMRMLGLRFSILVLETMMEKKIKLSALANHMDVSIGTLYHMLENQGRSVIAVPESVRRIRAIAEFLELSNDRLLALYLFNTDQDDTAELLAMVYQIRMLDATDKHLINGMINLLAKQRDESLVLQQEEGAVEET